MNTNQLPTIMLGIGFIIFFLVMVLSAIEQLTTEPKSVTNCKELCLSKDQIFNKVPASSSFTKSTCYCKTQTGEINTYLI